MYNYYLLEKKIKRSYILAALISALAGCHFFDGRTSQFKLRPSLHKIYNYNLLKTSESFNKSTGSDSANRFTGTSIFDTLKIDFSLENIDSNDSLITYKLKFNNLFINKKPFKIIFRNTGNSDYQLPKDPFAILDSIGYFIRGKSVSFSINHKGAVKDVMGADELLKDISRASSESERHIKSLISDYVSSAAVKDLMNKLFSVIPGFTVRENDRWIRNITLITKAPVKLSNLYILEQHNSDTAYVSLQSIISAQQSEGSNTYMKGKAKGIVMINYSTGMPYLFETRSETVTNTTAYEYISKEHFLIKEY